MVVAQRSRLTQLATAEGVGGRTAPAAYGEHRTPTNRPSWESWVGKPLGVGSQPSATWARPAQTSGTMLVVMYERHQTEKEGVGGGTVAEPKTKLPPPQS